MSGSLSPNILTGLGSFPGFPGFINNAPATGMGTGFPRIPPYSQQFGTQNPAFSGLLGTPQAMNQGLLNGSQPPTMNASMFAPTFQPGQPFARHSSPLQPPIGMPAGIYNGPPTPGFGWNAWLQNYLGQPTPGGTGTGTGTTTAGGGTFTTPALPNVPPTSGGTTDYFFGGN